MDADNRLTIEARSNYVSKLCSDSKRRWSIFLAAANAQDYFSSSINAPRKYSYEQKYERTGK
jgi:hypothetical protein